MHNKLYEATFSPFRSFTREEWKQLEEHPMFPVSDIDLDRLSAINEPLTTEELEEIYLPIVRLLQINITHFRRLHLERDEFFKRPSHRVPYIIGIAGSVAAGKSTTARVLQKLLSMTPGKPNVELVTTDGFLYPNAELENRGIFNRKGFPESYDAKRLLAFLSSAKSGQKMLKSPVYSHLYYNVLPGKIRTIREPDILIVEGINVLQVSSNRLLPKRRVFVSDFFDFSIYVDAAENDLRAWFLERFISLQKTAFQNSDSYFHRYATLSKEEAIDFASNIWDEINLPNLRENILPTRFRSDLILEKGEAHSVRGVRIRKI
ncbi:MAG: type I pantothenate kinase [Paludibacteraceae bacterium]